MIVQEKSLSLSLCVSKGANGATHGDWNRRSEQGANRLSDPQGATHGMEDPSITEAN